jgi:hypothetical protein
MAEVEQAAPKQETTKTESDHTQTIKTQVLEQTGKPPQLHHVEVCAYHNSNYRVNVWEKVSPTGDSAYSTTVHIGASYYVKVSDSGEILNSNPPLTQRTFPA